MWLIHFLLHADEGEGLLWMDPWATPQTVGIFYYRVDRSRLSSPEYVYISHIHDDHFAQSLFGSIV